MGSRLSISAGAALLMAFTASPGVAVAADLPDPTRPPLAQRRVVAVSASAASSSTAKPSAPVLQSILTGVGRKPSVIISGRLMAVGESFNDLRLMRVSETTAWFSGPHGQTALMLTPSADKLAVASTDTRLAEQTPRPVARRTVGLALSVAPPVEQK